MARPLLLLALLLFCLQQLTRPAVSDESSLCFAADSLRRLSDFFLRNSHKTDADGYFGASLAFAALNAAPKNALLSQLRVADSCGDAQAEEFRRSILALGQTAADFVARVTSDSDKVSAYDSKVYKGICRPLDSMVRLLLADSRFRWHHLKKSLPRDESHLVRASNVRTKYRGPIRYNESIGDACFEHLLTSRSGSRSSCRLSAASKRQFLHWRPNSGYTLTHKIIFWLASIAHSCRLTLSSGRPVDQTLIADACQRAFVEHRRILESRPLGNDQFDVALEQAVVCGVLGYRNFFIDSTVLRLRRKLDERLGCIAESGGASSSAGGRSNSIAVGTGTRKLMHDVLLDGICSSHSSGLAAAYLSLYLRV